MEMKKLRDSFKEFEEAETSIVGVSFDGVGSHKKWCDELELPFDLIADPDKKVHQAYGFKDMVRALVLIGKEGKILFVNKKFDLKEPSWKELMKEVEALKPPKK
jgi:thioredoxin-dependent peroxiredoxin